MKNKIKKVIWGVFGCAACCAVLALACYLFWEPLSSLKSSENVESGKNNFFYRFDGDEIAADVRCGLNYFEGYFSGEGTLKIRKIKDTKMEGFYEISLTDMRGNCEEHGDNISADCIYSGEFWIGYFYVSEDRVYMMSHDEDYLPFLCEMTTFPPTEQIEEWNGRLREQGARCGYFGYRLCCADEGMEDTFGMECDDGRVPEDYHNYIAVEDEKRTFDFYPDEVMGTQEHMRIVWGKDRGILYFANYTGNYKNFISFYADGYDEEFDER